MTPRSPGWLRGGLPFVLLLAVACSAGTEPAGESTVAQPDPADGGADVPADDMAAVEAMRRVLVRDAVLGRERNHASETMPAARAVRDYVEALRALDLTGTPPAFRRALEAHVDAWEALVPYLEQHPDRRGEMHALFEELTGEDNPTAAEFSGLVDRVATTWDEVEAAAGGAAVPTT